MSESSAKRIKRWGLDAKEDQILYRKDGKQRTDDELERILRGALASAGARNCSKHSRTSMKETLAEILDTESNWLRQAKADLLRRDPVDAVNDAESLLFFAQNQLELVTTKYQGPSEQEDV